MESKHLTKADAAFEVTVRRNILDRLRISWVPYRPKKGDARGEIIASPQWPEPFGPPIRRTLTLDDEIVIQPCDERTRENWLRCLDSLPAWSGRIYPRHMKAHEYLLVPDSRISLGRYMVFEVFNNVDVRPIYSLVAIDGFAVNLGDYILPVIKSSYDRAQEILDAQEKSLKEATIKDSDGSEWDIRRTPEEQKWRSDTEDKIAEVAAFEYRKKHSQYQSEPAAKLQDGERHPAGFVINDMRHREASN